MRFAVADALGKIDPANKEHLPVLREMLEISNEKLRKKNSAKSIASVAGLLVHSMNDMKQSDIKFAIEELEKTSNELSEINTQQPILLPVRTTNG